MTLPVTTWIDGGGWDVVLKGLTTGIEYGFLWAERAYPSQDSINNLAPAIRTGSDPAFQEATYDQWVIDGLHHGGDKELFESGDQRHQWSDGNVHLLREGRVQLASAWSSMDAAITATARNIIDFPVGDTWVCVGAGTKLRVYNLNDSTWYDSGSFTNNVVHIHSNDQYLFAAVGASENYWRWDGTSNTTTWDQPGAGFKANGFVEWHENLYRWLANQIIPATNVDGTTWGTAIDVGWASTDIEDAYVAQDYIFIAKPEGLYVYDGSNVHLVNDTLHIRSTGNFVGGANFLGALHVPLQNRVYKAALSSVNSATFTLLPTDMRGDANKERYGHGFPKVGFAGPTRLYMAFDDGEGVYPELLSHSGIGWFQEYRGTSGDTLRAAGYSRLAARLFVNDGATRGKRLTTLSDEPFPDFATSGQFTLPDYDAGFPDMLKSFRDITVDVQSGDTSNTVEVEYNLDAAGWVSMGTLTTTGKQTLQFGGAAFQIAGKRMALRLTLTRDSGDTTATPIVRLPIIVRVRPVPQAVHGHSLDVSLDVNKPLRNNQGLVSSVYSTARELVEILEYWEDAPETLRMTDAWGRIRYVKMSSLSLRHREVQPRTQGGPTETPEASMQFFEVFSGLISAHTATLTVTPSYAEGTAISSPVLYDSTGTDGNAVLGQFILAAGT